VQYCPYYECGREDTSQRVTYYYDSIPGYNQQWPFQNLPTGCCSNTAGRLAAVQFGSPNTNAWRSGYDVQQLLYIYSYNQAGRVTTQDLRLVGGQYSSAMDFTATYTWDNMGRMTGMNYPLNGPQVAMNYDAMSNLSSETQTTCQTWDPNQNWVCDAWYNPATLASATYNFAGQMTALSNYYDYAGGAYLQWTENHTYNGMMQLTNLTSSAPSGSQLLNMTYNFSATQNNGRIVSSVDAVTGENVSYTYDSLNRLIAAATTNRTGPIWGDSYSYDGFGNLTSKVPTQGNAPPASPQVNSATNQARMIGDYGFDANGNWLGAGGSQSNTWNVENQLISNGSVDPSGDLLTYTYDPWGKRVLQYGAGASGVPAGGTVYFYSISGQRLGTYQISYVLANDPPLPQSTTLYFGSRLLAPVDRLGSVRQNGNGPIAYFPWGEERPGANGTTPDGTDKFATYFRDVTNNGVGEDYASARYYNNNFGRFWSPDPGGVKAADPRNPITWNRYAYAVGDPVNFKDPRGTCVLWADDENGDVNPDYCLVESPAGTGVYHAIQETAGPGGGASNHGAYVNPLTIPGFLQAEAQALSALATPNCAALFGIAPNSWDPSDVLSSAVADAATGTTYALQFSTVQLQANDPIIATTAEIGSTTVTSDPWAYQNVNGQTVESTRVMMYINLTKWNSLTQTQQAQAIIHELGHAFDELIGAGGSQFVYDANPDGTTNQAAEATNAALVQKCISN